MRIRIIGEQQEAVGTDWNSVAENPDGQREDHRAGDQAANAAKITFSTATSETGRRREQTVIDLTSEAEVQHQRQGDALQRGGERRQGDDAWQQHRAEAGAASPMLGNTLPKMKRKNSGCSSVLQEEREEVAPGDYDVASQDSEECRRGEARLLVVLAPAPMSAWPDRLGWIVWPLAEVPPGKIDENVFEAGTLQVQVAYFGAGGARWPARRAPSSAAASSA